MAFPKYQTKEVLNKVLNAGEDGLNVDLADSVTVTVDSEFPAAAALSDDSSNPTTTSVGSHLLGYDSGNTNWNRVEVDDAGHLQIDVLSITAGDNNIGNVDIASIAAGDNNIGNVDIVSVPSPLSTTGGGTESGALRVTIANDSTGVLSVDDGGGILTVDGTVDLGSTATTHLSEIEGAVETIEGAVNGSEMQVDIVADGAGLATSANQSTANTHLGNLFYDTAISVSPNDGSDLTSAPYYSLFIGVGGDVKVDLNGSGTVTLKNLASGQLLPIVVDRVYSTGTTATDIVAMK